MASTPDAADGLSDDQTQYYLRLIFARNDARVTRLNQADWVDLTPRSALVGDDRATQPYQLSHAVCSGIADAVEQLHAVSTLLRDANTLHPSAPLVLARCAIESASNAAWMLTPRSRPEMVRRRMVLHVLDIEDSAKATTEAQLEPPRTKAERLLQAQQIADAAHGDTATNLKDQGSRTATSRIRQVALDVDSNFSILLAWMVGSGFAHGRPWASLSMLEAVQQIELGDGVLLRRSTGTLQGVVWAAGAADLVITHALSLFTKHGATRPDADPAVWSHAYDRAKARP